MRSSPRCGRSLTGQEKTSSTWAVARGSTCRYLPKTLDLSSESNRIRRWCVPRSDVRRPLPRYGYCAGPRKRCPCRSRVPTSCTPELRTSSAPSPVPGFESPCGCCGRVERCSSSISMRRLTRMANGCAPTRRTTTRPGSKHFLPTRDSICVASIRGGLSPTEMRSRECSESSSPNAPQPAYASTSGLALDVRYRIHWRRKRAGFWS